MHIYRHTCVCVCVCVCVCAGITAGLAPHGGITLSHVLCQALLPGLICCCCGVSGSPRYISYVCIYTYTHIYTYMCVCVCVCVYTCTYTHNIDIHVCVYIYVYVCINIYLYIYMYIYTERWRERWRVCALPLGGVGARWRRRVLPAKIGDVGDNGLESGGVELVGGAAPLHQPQDEEKHAVAGLSPLRASVSRRYRSK